MRLPSEEGPPLSGDALRADLLARIRVISGTRSRIGDHTRLYHDLGIAGDDMGDLLESIHRRHGTTFVGFNFEKYVPNESDALIYWWMRLFGYKGRRFRELRFGHLVAVVEHAAWFEPPPGPGFQLPESG